MAGVLLPQLRVEITKPLKDSSYFHPASLSLPIFVRAAESML